MAVLITGGAGYIGSHTCIELINAGYNIVVVDNLCNSCRESLNRVMTITGRDIPFVNADLCNKEELAKVFNEYKDIDSVIHFAGLKAVGESVEKPLEYYSTNIVSTINLLAAMKTARINKFVFSSSATVYGKPTEVPISEKHSTGGTTNPYGTTKYFIERIISDYCNAEKDFSAVVLRYFNPIGAHESGLIGEDPNGIPNNLVPYIAQVAIGKLDILHVYGNDYDTYDGTGVRDYIHVMDLAKGHVAALSKIDKESGIFIYNLGTGKGYSVLDVINAYERACGKKIPYVIDERREGDVAECYSNPEKAFKELGWSANLDINDMCFSSWKWQSMNPNGYIKVE